MAHVVLLGDSIFDNATYVPGGPSVIEHLRHALPKNWRATLLARDGAITADVVGQLKHLPSDVSHLVVSAGGNNALDYSSLILNEPAGSFLEVLARLAEVRDEFQREYRGMLREVLLRDLPVVVCTVYDAIPGLSSAEKAGLALFNEVILREAFRAAVGVLDLRLLCADPADYATTSPIEPSVVGGGKIARVLARVVTTGSVNGMGSRVFT